MTRQLKAFATCDTFTDNTPGVVRSLYELSAMGQTYSKNKKQYHSTENALMGLHSFKEIDMGVLTQSEINSILRVVDRFVIHCTHNPTLSKNQAVLTFLNNYNAEFVSEGVNALTVGAILNSNELYGPDFMSFETRGILCAIWLNDVSFRNFFNDYEIDVVFGREDFLQTVQNSALFLNSLSAFSLTEFMTRVETAKAGVPASYTRVLNLPYHLPNSSVVKDCYFAFNLYGGQGNYDYVLKLHLYQLLMNAGLTSTLIEQLFPSILQINEFFITPCWDRVAIPSHVGENGILSQVSKAFSETFDTMKYVKVYSDANFVRDNTYNVPCDYNNILLRVTNGFYSDVDKRDFHTQYSDLITVTSTHPDFARMSTKTQRFMTLLENFLFVADSDSQTELLTKIVDNENFTFHMVSRQGIWYVSFFFEGFQCYVIPKYEYMSALVA